MNKNKQSILSSYKKVTIENKSYGRLNGVVFYVDERLPKNDFDYLTSPKGKRGFRFGKHLLEGLGQHFKNKFIIALTQDDSRVVKDGTRDIIYINYEAYNSLARNEFIYVRRDAGLSTAGKFLTKYFNFKVPFKTITKPQAEQVVQNFEKVIDKVKKTNQNEIAVKLLDLIRGKRIKLTDETLNNLSAATKQTYYDGQIKRLEKRVKSNFKKSNLDKKWENTFYKPWFKKNYWMFGIDYKKMLPKTQVSSRQNVDLLLQTYDGYLDIIEIKTPNVELFKYDKSHNCYYPSPDLSSAVNQAILYISKMETLKLDVDSTAKDEGEDAITLKPRCKLVIGHRGYWNKDNENIQKKKNDTLRLLNDSLPNVDIFTFDDVLTIGKLMLERYGKKFK